MPNVFEDDKPDARQQGDIQPSRFRPRYRQLTAAELALHDQIKAAYEEVEKLIGKLPAGRYRALALTELELSCMWAIKELTS